MAVVPLRRQVGVFRVIATLQILNFVVLPNTNLLFKIQNRILNPNVFSDMVRPPMFSLYFACPIFWNCKI